MIVGSRFPNSALCEMPYRDPRWICPVSPRRRIILASFDRDVNMAQDIGQVACTEAPARPVAAGGWGAHCTLSVVYDDVHPAAHCAAGAAEVAGGADEPSPRRWRSREARLLGEAVATADRQRDEFLAVLSHELRSPLAAIRNAAHILGGAATGATARRRAQQILERQLLRVTGLIDEILDLSRLTLGRVPLHRERMDLRVAVNQAIETMASEIHERHHRLIVALPDTPVWLQGDGRRLEQVFVNLLGNACKFTDAGGELTVRLHTLGAQAIAQIQDSGIGIEADALPHIFDAFKQTAEGARRSNTGLGVGLALVRAFVTAHGGSVVVRSAGQGRGAEFSVQLPTEA